MAEERAVLASDDAASPTATTNRAAEATDRILRAALDLFAEVGFGSATVEMIAERAEVGIASLYRRWEDKPALANALYAQVLDEMVEAVIPGGELPDSTASDADRFMSVWLRLWDFAAEDPARFMFIELPTYAAFMSSENRTRKHELVETNGALLSSLGLDIDPLVASGILIGSIVGVLQLEADPEPERLGRRAWAALSADV